MQLGQLYAHVTDGKHYADWDPKFGYVPEGSKSWLIVKKKVVKKSQSVFKDTNIKITTEGQRRIGGAVGLETFKLKYVQEKIDQ